MHLSIDCHCFIVEYAWLIDNVYSFTNERNFNNMIRFRIDKWTKRMRVAEQHRTFDDFYR